VKTQEQVDEENRKHKERMLRDREKGLLNHDWVETWLSLYPDEPINLSRDELMSLVYAYDSIQYALQQEYRRDEW